MVCFPAHDGFAAKSAAATITTSKTNSDEALAVGQRSG
jgi:hypothetical protein